ncbi:MAG TPA: hypothetical protein VGR53_01370 [Nitrososphaerales archaeon]|nr:hypothetical protein [Nitrososphaerales archaeon]
MAVVGLAAADLLWFSAYVYLILPNVSEYLAVYLLYFGLWALGGALVVLALNNGKVRIGLPVFVLAVVLSYGIGRTVPSVYPFAFAYPGAFNGAGVMICLILFKRHVLKNAQMPYARSNRAWKDQTSRYSILSAIFAFPSLIVFALYFYLGEPSALAYLAFGLVIVGMVFSIRSTASKRRHRRSQKNA